MMPYKTANNTNQGFTLIEVITVLILLGISASIALPNMGNWYRNYKLEQAMTEVSATLSEASQNASRRSQNCSVLISSDQISSSNNCLYSSLDLPQEIELSSSNASINFNFDGTSSTNTTTIVLSHEGNSKLACVVISQPLALIRTGVYQGSASPISENNCTLKL